MVNKYETEVQKNIRKFQGGKLELSQQEQLSGELEFVTLKGIGIERESGEKINGGNNLYLYSALYFINEFDIYILS